MGFIQMGAGFLAGLLAAAIGMPLFAFGTIIPAMGLMAILSYVWYRAICSRDAQLAAEPAE
jgi:DHA1 family bicyclomycin/chloramphenicol resistance-like MFS transporter